MLLSPDSQFFQYFNDASGVPVPGTASPPKAVTPQSQPTPNVPEDDDMGDTAAGRGSRRRHDHGPRSLGRRDRDVGGSLTGRPRTEWTISPSPSASFS